MKLIEGWLWRLGYVSKSEAQHNEEQEKQLRVWAEGNLDSAMKFNKLLREDVKRLEGERNEALRNSAMEAQGSEIVVAHLHKQIEELKQERADVLIKSHNNALRKAKPKATRKRAA